MGFWSKSGKGIAGGVVGFVTGGPLGAAAGAASGLLSSDGKQTGTSESTSRVNLRDLTPDEQRIQDQSTAGLLEASRPLTPEEQEAMRQRTFSGIFDPARKELAQTYETAGARDYAAESRRGASGGSRGEDKALLRTAAEGSQAADLSARSTLAADESVLREEANRRASAQAYLNNLNSVWQNRIASSSVTTSGTSTTLSPDTFWQSAAQGLGIAIGDEDSYLNSGDLFGGV